MTQKERRIKEKETLILLLDELGFLLNEEYIEVNDKNNIIINNLILPENINVLYTNWFLKPWRDDVFFYLKNEINRVIYKLIN